ncbi:MAG: hypothetical protein OHK0028_03360 [Deltaproteobacteria bacterium]
MSNRLHWVNLEKKDVFAKDGIPSKSHMTQWVGVTVRFREIFGEDFKMRLVPWPPGSGNKNAVYSENERKRNTNFRFWKIPLQRKEGKDKKVFLQESAHLRPSGGDQYKIEAKYGEKVVVSPTILETRRRLYYEVISMKGGDCLDSFSDFETTFEGKADKFFIEMKEKGGARNGMVFLKTLRDGNTENFLAAARKAYSIKDYEPYAVAVVFANYIAEKKSLLLEDRIDLSAPSKLVMPITMNPFSFTRDVIQWSDFEFVVNVKNAAGEAEYLWHGLDDQDDRNREWVKRAYFFPENGDAFKIDTATITTEGGKKGSLGGYSKVRVRIPKEKVKKMMGVIKGTLFLDLNVVDGFSGGLSYTEMNLIVICTKSWWEKERQHDMLQVIVHEMGHKIGMVANGAGTKPDKPAPDKPGGFYSDREEGKNYEGHRGPHCNVGCAYTQASDSWTGVPGCVMFGATSCGASPSPATFCADCAKVVRKLDLDGSRLPGLKNRF